MSWKSQGESGGSHAVSAAFVGLRWATFAPPAKWFAAAVFAWLALRLTAVAGPPDLVPPGLTSATFRGVSYSVREVDPRKDDLELFWKDEAGNLLHDFNGLEKYVASKGETLLFAANAGMFEPDSKPVGLLVQNGAETTPINLNDGQGNFYLKPNGVFEINEKHEGLIVAADSYAGLLTPPVWATQSGPLLLQRGDIHPEFNSESKNLKIRSGVGVRKDGTVVFALSRGLVNFYDFALFFRDKLKCPNALFLDGEISGFWVPSGGAIPETFGPMFGIVAKTP